MMISIMIVKVILMTTFVPFNYPQIDMIKTGENIRSLCEENNLSACAIERLFNISNQSVYTWFSGKSLPSLDNLLALSSLLNVHMEELLVYSV